ncbi:MAG TPA: 8-oxoguanine DNA glycosylase, partial [Clostridiales bacterium]|nr:8-oxoguanine DNA glycosylase [Clostridiales bacterium]
MIEQEYRIKNQESFELKHIFDCGQCFRWNEEDDQSYTGVFKGNVLNVKKEKDTIIFKGIVNGNIKEVVEDYFDLK